MRVSENKEQTQRQSGRGSQQEKAGRPAHQFAHNANISRLLCDFRVYEQKVTDQRVAAMVFTMFDPRLFTAYDGNAQPAWPNRFFTIHAAPGGNGCYCCPTSLAYS